MFLMPLAAKIYEAISTLDKIARITLLPSLTQEQLKCLEQLVTPVWDGNLISKVGRDQLVDQGLAARWDGLNFATQDGMVILCTLGFMQDSTKFKGGLPWLTYGRRR